MEPRILLVDIETAPLQVFTWGIYDQNVGLNQIVDDWAVLSWAAKWLGKKPVMYQDSRKSKNLRDDSKLLNGIWKLLDEADIIITQNGKKFDVKKLNARFVINGMTPPSSFQHIDTRQLAKKHFGFTSNSLEYMSDKLCTKYKKLKHKKFPGQELWTECLRGNLKAWDEMEKYNKHDVLALEELYTKLIPWGSGVNFSLYFEKPTCSCGNTSFLNRGFIYTKTSRYRRFRCKRCGTETRSRVNEFKNKLPVETTR